MPAVTEDKHSIGKTSGLTRLKGLKDTIPSIASHYKIVTPDEDKLRIVTSVNRKQFIEHNVCYFP